MLELNLNVYSRSLLGGSGDPSTVQRKISLLNRLDLINPITRTVIARDVTDLVSTFRIAHFTGDDLSVCRDFSIDDISSYHNPCNSRKAIKYAIEFCEREKLDYLVKDLQIEMNRLFSGVPHQPFTASYEDQWSAFPSITKLDHCVRVIEGSHGYSLVADRSLSRGDKVISLPPGTEISILSAMRDPNFPGEDLFHQGLHPDTIFLLYLCYLRERAGSLDNPIHRDFFLCQPDNYGTLFELPESFVRAIDEPDLLASVTSQNGELRDICRSLQPEPKFEDMLWVKSLCISRAFSLPMKPQSSVEERIIAQYYPSGLITTILPVIHFFNHDIAAQCETPVVEADGSVIVRSLVSVEMGSEIFIIYGGFTNKEFLLNYGFFVPNNPYDSHITVDGKYSRRGAVKDPKPASEISVPPDVPEEYISLVRGYLTDRSSFLNSIV